MKTTIKFLLVAVLTLGATALFAQKFGRIDMQAVIQAMPEMTDVQLNFEKAQKDYEDHLEGLQVELNNKVNDLQKNQATMTEQSRQLKQRDIQDLQQRLQQYYQLAQEELEKTQTDLMTPLYEKADAAIKKICKAEGIIVAFTIGQMAYIDDAATVDITEKVKKELGATATPAATPAAASAAPKK
jgi:outer membrane protein